MASTWTPASWRGQGPAGSCPSIPTPTALARVEAQLSRYPPLVFAGEARGLKATLGRGRGRQGFLFQGGDCAETFAEFHPDNIRDRLRVLLQMAVVLTYGQRCRWSRSGEWRASSPSRARHRPSETAICALPAYRGDIVNGDRVRRGTRAPIRSACSAPMPRRRRRSTVARLHRRRLREAAPGAQLDAGLHGPLARGRSATTTWPTGSARRSDFMEACGVTDETAPELRRTKFYT